MQIQKGVISMISDTRKWLKILKSSLEDFEGMWQ